MEKNGRIKHMQITHASSMEEIHSGYRKVYENIATALIRSEIGSIRFSLPCRYFSDEHVRLEKTSGAYGVDPDGKPVRSVGILRDMTVGKRHGADA